MSAAGWSGFAVARAGKPDKPAGYRFDTGWSSNGEDGMRRTIIEGGVEIAAETFGDPAHPTLLLIMGAMASMLWWPQAFCEALAGRGLHVVRYDNRDTGRSTKYEPGKPPYTFDDMADDAIRVLDGHGVAAAHIVGMSMGGMIAQIVALKYPGRTLSLTAISTSPIGIDTSHLPSMKAAYKAHSAKSESVDWPDRAGATGYMIEDVRMLTGSGRHFDEAGTRAFVEADYDRSGGLLNATNHFMLQGGSDWKGCLGGLDKPLLVIHGTSDPIFPIEHGEALAEAVKDAALLRIEGGGHELNRQDWPAIVETIARHAGLAQPSQN
jgi:pimeloyl-ACP methyl ester carboxylesterase